MEESQGDERENSVEMILVKLIFRLFFVQKVKETMIINLSVSSNAYPEFCKFLFIGTSVCNLKSNIRVCNFQAVSLYYPNYIDIQNQK